MEILFGKSKRRPTAMGDGVSYMLEHEFDNVAGSVVHLGRTMRASRQWRLRHIEDRKRTRSDPREALHLVNRKEDRLQTLPTRGTYRLSLKELRVE